MSVAQPPGVHPAHPRDPADERLHGVRRLPVLAEDEHIGVDLADLAVEEQNGRDVVERRDDGAPGEDRGGLLRRTSIRYDEGERTLLVEAERVDAVDDDFPGERLGEPLEQCAVSLIRNRDDDDVGRRGHLGIGRPAHRQVALLAELVRRGLSPAGVPGADDDAVAGEREPPGEAAALVAGAAEDPDGKSGDGV